MTDHKAALERLDGMTSPCVFTESGRQLWLPEFSALYAAGVKLNTARVAHIEHDGSGTAAERLAVVGRVVDAENAFDAALTALAEKINAG